MKMPSAKAKVKAFTLVELLAVIFVVVFFAVGSLQALKHTTPSHSMPQCLTNLRQIDLDFIVWEDDNGGMFPWQVPATNGGTMEFAARGYAAPTFQILSTIYNNLPTSIFVCPTDNARIAATNYAQFNNRSLSYFVNVGITTNSPALAVLAGERHLQANGRPVRPGLLALTNNTTTGWTRELHGNGKDPFGYMAFADGHSEFVRTDHLNSIVQNQPLATNRLCIP